MNELQEALRASAFAHDVLKATIDSARSRGISPAETSAAMMMALARMMAICGTAALADEGGAQVWEELSASPARDLFVLAYDAQRSASAPEAKGDA